MKNAVKITLLGGLLLLAGCATHKNNYDYSAFNTVNPRSILVVPVLNNTVDVDAPLFALSTLAVPLGNKGYYVFPVNTVKTVLEQEGLYEGEAIKQLGAPSLASMFGADSVMFVEIQRWDAQYAILATTVTVSITYTLQDPQGNTIWDDRVTTQYTPNNNSTGNPMADLVAAAITAGITRAAPNYIPLMQQANQLAFISGDNPIPDGPYAIKKKK